MLIYTQMELLPFGWWCMYFVVAFPMVRHCEAQIRAIPCPRGSFGSPDCQGTCHCLSGNDYCRWEDGRCTDGKCSFGWINPPICQTACPYGMFGYNCSLLCRCPPDDVCSSINGYCSSNKCLQGWGGPSCQRLLPVLVSPPDVTATTESQVTLTWPKWIPGQTGLGVGNVISHTLQQLDNVTNSWKDVVNLQDSSALMRFTYTVVNLTANTAYKYRIRLVMEDSHKPLPSVPSPESSKWIITNCSAPSGPPTNVTAEMIENQHKYIRVTWTPPSLGSMNCNGLARHEIFIACVKPNVDMKASEEWPANVSIIQYFNCTNSMINITVRAINDAGLAGPLSVPFHILLSGEKSLGVIDNAADATFLLTSGDPSVDTTVTSMTTSGTEDVTANTTEDVTTDRAKGVTIEESDTTEDVTTDTTADVTTESDTTADVTTELDMTADVTTESDKTPDVTADVSAATTSDVTTDTTAYVTTDSSAGVTTATRAGVTLIMTGGVIKSTTTGETDRSTSHVMTDIATDVTTDLISSTDLEETTDDVMSAITSTSQRTITTRNITENVTISLTLTDMGGSTTQSFSLEAETEIRRQSQEISQTLAGIETKLNSTQGAHSSNRRVLSIYSRGDDYFTLVLRPVINYTFCLVNVEDLDNGRSALSLSVHKQCLTGGVINITGLLPATKYRITVQIQGFADILRRYTIVLFTAPPAPPRPPTPIISEVSASGFKLNFTTRKRSTVILSQRLVVIERLESNKSYFQDLVDSGPTYLAEDRRSTFKHQRITLDEKGAQLLNLSFYVAGIVDSNEFVVGDGRTFECASIHPLLPCPYTNVPLVPNSSYMVWFVWENSLDGVVRRLASGPAGPVLTLSESAFDPTSQGGLSAAMIILIVLCLLLFFIIFLILIIVLLWRRAKVKRQTNVETFHAPHKHLEHSSVNRNLAVSYPNSFLIPRSVQKDFDAISGVDGDFLIPDACLVYECIGSSISRSCPVPVQKLRDFCSARLLVDSGCSLEEQFLMLPNCFTDSVNVAMSTCNTIHNRSAQVVPYDRNRVKLKYTLPQSTTYVNASFVRTIGRRYCIVTQCPMLSTFGNFWQMVWERGSSTIVMLMDSEAPDSQNFDCYWPEMPGKCHSYDNIHVELVSVNIFANYSVRHFKIGEVNAIRERHVFHWQYVSWSKGGVPKHPIPFLSFVKRIREERTSDTGFLVHCRTGGGRSGVYIAVDTLLTQGHNTGIVDVLRLVTLLHAERSNLVKSFVQYCFIYDCLCEEFDHNPSRYLAERFVMTFEGLEKSDANLKTLTCEQQVMLQLPVYSDFLTRSLVSRMTMPPEACVSNQNADEDNDLSDLDPYPFQTLSGFIKRDMFIASRHPSDTYCDDFWHSITDNHVNCIVMLNKMGDLPDAKRLLPQMGQSVNSKHFSVVCTSVKVNPSNIFVAYNLKVRPRNFQDDVGAHNVRLFEFSKWPCDDEVPSIGAMLELLEQLRQWMNRYSANRPVLLFSACGNGKSRAALLMVLWYVLEQSEKEGILDIFSTCRLIRSYIVSSMDHRDHYHFMYLAVRDFLKRNLAYYTLSVESKDQLSSTYRPGWTSPSKRQSTSASRAMSIRGQPLTSELPLENSEESPNQRLESQHRIDSLRRNLYFTDLEEAANESMAVTDKESNHSRLYACPTTMQICAPECVDVEKPAQQSDFKSGFVSPIAAHLAGQNSNPILTPSASQLKSGQKNAVDYEEQRAGVLPQPRVRGLRAAKKSDAKEDQGGEACTIPPMNDTGPAEYAAVIKTSKSSEDTSTEL